MVNNLRISTVEVVDNVSIKIFFTDALHPTIGASNVSIESKTWGVPNPQILKTRVKDNALEIGLQPLTSFAAYNIICYSTNEVQFKSINGTAILLEDGISNKFFFNGPLESDNPIKEYFVNYLSENVYNTEPGTFVNSALDVLSSSLSTLSYDIKQAKNENYLSTTIVDERKIRGHSAFDRLNEEGAYEILRVGKTETNTNASLKLSISQFARDPVSLLQKEWSEELIVNSSDSIGSFNINSFILNLSKRFIIKLKSVVFKYSDGYLPYNYNIESLGYQTLDEKYDTNYAFKYLSLGDNQIKLSDKILEDSNFSTNNIFKIEVKYDYKDTGRIIDQSTILVNKVENAGREVLPPLYNVFNLKHAPIVTNSNKIGTIGNIKFIDQNQLSVPNASHPAFTNEIPYRLDFLPSSAGEYSVDYETGTVYVFGSDFENDGTGATPPLAQYYFRQVFKENVDWVIDEDTNDLVALPNGSLINNSSLIEFDYEQVLAKNIDYVPQIHQEVLEERVENRLAALNIINTLKTPITNVFRVFNETTGEIYPIIRWTDNKIYFSYNKAPNIQEIIGERASFDIINNEVMFVADTIPVSSTLNIYQIELENNNIMSSSEDCIGASFNSSLSLSNLNIFKRELYFDPLQTDASNLSRLVTVGDYMVDYTNGVIYITVSVTQDYNIGTVSYKRGYVVPSNPHVTSIGDIYYQFNVLSAKNKKFDYIDFENGLILPKSFDMADEQLLGNNLSQPLIVSGNKIGAIVNASFLPGLSDRIYLLRGIFESNDLINNPSPLNFTESSVFDGKIVTVNPISKSEYHTVAYDGVHYYVTLNTGLQYQSPNITSSFSVIRIDDDQQLWDNSGIVVTGNLVRLNLSGVGAPQVGDSVLVTYSYTINNLSHVTVDYNKGEYYIDYDALVDELIVSYEYGNNSLDFRQSMGISAGETYYVTYKAGALREALLKNFGSLIDIPLLNSLDVTFSRERYRDALMAAMQCFSQGPTVAAIKKLAQIISHLPAELKESAFEGWSLGTSLLAPASFDLKGNFELVHGKYNDGIQIDQPEQQIQLPIISNFKTESGTLETWIRPEWDGIDNIAQLKVVPMKDGYLASPLEVFVGALEYHPEYELDRLTGKSFIALDKNKRVEGTPNKNKDGIYVYYDRDISGGFNRWYIDVIDGYANDGYSADGYATKKYSVNVETEGKFYDVKSTKTSPSGRITSGGHKLNFSITGRYPNEGITFIADIPHYIFDFAENETKNRFSVFKDESGYLNFKIYDSLEIPYTISSDVSDWRHGELHHVAVSWKLNTTMGRDEMHLFVDGFEVPNIIKYGDRISPYLHEKFRTVNPEEIVGAISSNIICGNDLETQIGSNDVESFINFSQYGIEPGDTLYVEETGFNSSGYTVSVVNGNVVTLTAPMPASIQNGSFSVNKTELTVKSEIDIYPNMAVAVLHSFMNGVDMVTTANSNSISSAAQNFVTAGVIPGDFIRIITSGSAKYYTILTVSSHMLTVNDKLPATSSGNSFYLYHNDEEEIPGLRAIKPGYSLSKSNDGYLSNVLTIRDKAIANDIVLIKTLGINHRRVRRKYYVWGNTSNILKTKLSSPISLDETKINKIIVSQMAVGPTNSSIVSGSFVSSNLSADQPSNDATGRTLSVTIKGDNIDFTTPTTISIDGYIVAANGVQSHYIETLSFSKAGTKDTVSLFAKIEHVNATTKPKSTSKNGVLFEIKEKYSITELQNVTFAESNNVSHPVVKYSYQVGVGNSLHGDGYHVTDNNKFFSDSLVGGYLFVYGPTPVVGFYQIFGVSTDHLTLELDSSVNLPSFTDGYYQILKASAFRSGLQNGYFTFENANVPGEPYYLSQGSYDLDYFTYLNLPLKISSGSFSIGSDFQGKNQIGGVIDEFQILNTMLTDTRIGETAPSTQRTITKEFNSLKAAKADASSLVLSHFDTIPPLNEANVYISAEKEILQSGEVINDNFGSSLLLADNSVIVNNNGILDTKREATIEFWINPIFDTSNDPNYRFYFDASGAVTETLTSINNVTVQLIGSASEINYVKLAIGDQELDYFAGGSLSANGKTLNLNKELPNQNTNITVSYIPKGMKGDRISIFKDPFGYVNFNVRANQEDYLIRSLVMWSRNTWHRVKASYKVNGGNSSDEMHFMIDGYEIGNILFGSGLLFDQGLVYGSSYAGPNNHKYNINFSDQINQINIGSDVNGGFKAYCLMDNLRISNIMRPIYKPFGEPIDPNYSTNLDMVFPITEDLYTTLLINFDSQLVKQDSFAILNDQSGNSTDFSLEVLDSLGIVNSDDRVKLILEALVKALKPANSRAFVKYV